LKSENATERRHAELIPAMMKYGVRQENSYSSSWGKLERLTVTKG
jgi:hypothetical protein